MLYLTILGQGRVELTWPDIMMGVIYNYIGCRLTLIESPPIGKWLPPFLGTLSSKIRVHQMTWKKRRERPSILLKRTFLRADQWSWLRLAI